MENKQTDNTTFDERIDEIMSNLWTKESPFGQVLQGDDEVKAQLQVLITQELAKKEQARIEAELRAKIEAEELAKKEQSAPDKDKLTRFVKGLELVVESKLPLVESDRAKDIAKAIELGLEELIAKAKSEISQL